MSYEFIIAVDNTDEVIKAMHEQVADALERIGRKASEQDVQPLTPVDTGTLRDSWDYKVAPDEQAVYIGTDEEYGKFVEHGTGIYAESGNGRQTPWVYRDRNGKYHTTVGMRPHRMLRKGIENNLTEYKQIVEDALKG